MLNITIQNPDFSDLPALKALWREAFGEGESGGINADKEVDLFFDNLFNPEMVLTAKADGLLCGMVHLLCSVLHFNGKDIPAFYLYAAATKKEYKNCGIMTALEKEASSLALKAGGKLICLVPASNALFKMYKKFGYRTAAHREIAIIAPMPSVGYSLEPCEKDDFILMRQELLKKKKAYIDLDYIGVSYRFLLLNSTGEILKYKDLSGEGYLVCTAFNGVCRIMESDLSIEPLSKAAFALTLRYSGIKRIEFCGFGRRLPYAMAKNLDGDINPFDIGKSNCYLNLMLD